MSSTSKPRVAERSKSEDFWVSHYNFLLHRGYQLRQRYHPDWIPSWELDIRVMRFYAEDYRVPLSCHVVMDARRLSDGQKVVFKKVNTKTHEIQILTYLSHPERRSNPRNRSVPLLDVIPLPGNDEHALIVMPVLMQFTRLPFRRVGEVGEALEQLFDTVAYLHEENIVHGDACLLNFMVDPSEIIPDGWHFASTYFQEDGKTPIKWIERTLTSPNHYYLVDYDLSWKVKGKSGKWMGGKWGQDKTVPEMTGPMDPCDGFKVDVYQMGNIINDLIEDYTGLEMFKHIADQLTAKDPNTRPSAASASQLIRDFNAKQWRWVKATRIWQRPPYGPDFKTRLMITYFNEQTIQ